MPGNQTAIAPKRQPYILKVNSSGRRMETVSFDDEYVQRLIEGDQEVERHFIAYFEELMWIKLRSRVRSPQLQEDIRQETFLRVLKNLRSSGMEHPERLGAYVNSVCNNVVFESFRAEGKFLEMPVEGPAMIDPSSGAYEHCISRERQEQVAAVLGEMPEKDRDLLKAVFMDDADKDEICRRHGVDRNYLRVQLHRARLRFREIYTRSYTRRR